VCFAQLNGWRVIVTAEAIALAVGFSVAVGIFFRVWPARQATRERHVPRLHEPDHWSPPENRDGGGVTMRRITLLLLWAALAAPAAVAQEKPGFAFDIVKQIPTTSVKNQAQTGTCWSFASSSFLETELLRMGKEPVDLSEMYFVRMTYPQKAWNYVRLHGNATLGEGSVGGDVLRALRDYGAVPDEAYQGRRYGAEQHDHGELFGLLEGAVKAVVGRRLLSPVWPDAVDGILDAYLGRVPETFTYRGTTYTPRSFADALGLDPNAYVELTSFGHHPFNAWFAIEIPDNWARNRSFNLPLDQLMGVIDHAIEQGFSVDWDGDVSERGFCHAKGVAVLPAVPWETRSEADRQRICGTPEAEPPVTQDVRQRLFDSHSSTDDHLMHIVGVARDQNGTKYYLTKNSWGVTGAQDGYVYMSESYVRGKTISIIVHRDALPPTLKEAVAEE
jgi:bleomycin hydrolase